MANTFKIDTKSSVSTSGNNVVTAGGSATLVILSILIANKTAASAQVDVFVVKITKVAEPPAETTLVPESLVPALLTEDLVSILKVFAILS